MSIVTIVGEKNEISVERLQRLVTRLYFPPPLGGWGVYRYNTLNQVVARQSPDGGLSEFWYDRLGRLVISRNARQKGASASEEGRLYSYTKYDSIGRITEVGQVSNTSANGAMTDDISRDPVLLDTWLATLDNRRGQITNTVYDLPYPGFDGVGDPRLIIEQKNLRNRVSYTTITDTGTSNVYSQGTFYTYDILGNVDHLLQDYGSSSYSSSANVMNKNENRWKKISYQYDLISGKVNMVMYQHEWTDGFFHRYSYDAENRLTLVETSRDSLVWDKDARYEYYRHGPLARVTLGDQQVQGLDYAYTLQGWLKGINSTGGKDSLDMGQDGHIGSLNQYTARDALGLTLNYFANDYMAINGLPFPGYSAYLPSGTYRPLYNGNISSSSVYQKKFDYDNSPGGPLIFYNYRYDQLNRLTGQDGCKGYLNTSTGLWDSLSTNSDMLKERIVYDGNGNILKYLRKGIDGGHMDSLNYFYYAGTNQLKRITDSIPPNTYISEQDNLILDIDNQPDNNYGYDGIGNLIKDSAEKVTSIKWNVYGKVQEVNRIATTEVPATNIKYTYDALGNRISEVVTTADNIKYTWYVRDAQGNIMSTYTAEGDDDLENLTLKQSEKFLYGSRRLGTMSIGETFNGGPDPMEYYYGVKQYSRGDKQFELTNHLGNVLATISDRKFGVSLSDTSSLISYYEPDIVTAQDYYPFGMMSRVALPNSGVPYKFGFNGKLNDNEVKGLGNQIDYGARIYDVRIGRFLSTDPLFKGYPWNSPYAYAENDVLRNIDLDGGEKKHYLLVWDAKHEKALLVYSHTEHFTETSTKWTPTLTDWTKTTTTTVTDPRVEYVVHGVVKVPLSADGMFKDDIRAATWTFATAEEMYGKENARRADAAKGSGGWGPSHDWISANSDQHLGIMADQVLMYSIESQATKTIYSPNVFRGYVNYAVKGVLAKANWAQSKINKAGLFSSEGQALYSKIAGTQIRTVDDLAGALKSGKVTPSQITVDYIMKDGVPVILNTRTSVALIKAGIKQEEWYGINRTGEEVSGLPGVTYDKLAEDQIQRNKLSSTGTSTPPAKN